MYVLSFLPGVQWIEWDMPRAPADTQGLALCYNGRFRPQIIFKTLSGRQNLHKRTFISRAKENSSINFLFLFSCLFIACFVRGSFSVFK